MLEHMPCHIMPLGFKYLFWSTQTLFGTLFGKVQDTLTLLFTLEKLFSLRHLSHLSSKVHASEDVPPKHSLGKSKTRCYSVFTLEKLFLLGYFSLFYIYVLYITISTYDTIIISAVYKSTADRPSVVYY